MIQKKNMSKQTVGSSSPSEQKHSDHHLCPLCGYLFKEFDFDHSHFFVCQKCLSLTKSFFRGCSHEHITSSVGTNPFQKQIEIFQFYFNNIPNGLNDMRPSALFLPEHIYHLHSWESLYIQAVSRIVQRNPDIIKPYCNGIIRELDEVIFFSKKVKSIICTKIAENVYLKNHSNPDRIVRIIRFLIDLYKCPMRDYRVEYYKYDNKLAEKDFAPDKIIFYPTVRINHIKADQMILCADLEHLPKSPNIELKYIGLRRGEESGSFYLIHSWTEVLYFVAEAVLNQCAELPDSLKGYYSDVTHSPLFANQPYSLRFPYEIKRNLFLEIGFDVPTTKKIIELIARCCKSVLINYSIFYTYIKSSSFPEKNQKTPPKKQYRRFSARKEFNQDTDVDEIQQIIEMIISEFSFNPECKVTFKLDIEAESPDPFDCYTVSTIRENCDALNMENVEFREQ